MKLNSIILIAAVFVFIINPGLIYSQSSSLYIPVNISKLYKKGTRSFTGKPGINYWQNGSDYMIKAEINPETRMLNGTESITYHNNSPDSLSIIILRLYQDYYKKGAARDFQINPIAVNDGVKISRILANKKLLDLSDDNISVRRSGTNMIINLPEKINAHDSLTLNIDWNFTIPKESGLRMGTYLDSAFFVSYWYPQVSVYDDVDGWDRNQYRGMVEFYNDFSNYDVEINVPGGYAVWAAGRLVNAADVLSKEVYDRFVKASISDEVVHIITKSDISNRTFTKGRERQTWKFKANHIPDFSFALSDFYLWDAASVVVDSSTGRRTRTGAVYPEGTNNFDKVAGINRKTIQHLSTVLPGVPYPYLHITIFCNGNKNGGMETPMMANNGDPFSVSSTASLTFHEIAHSYFPFYMGTNERKYAWMDEGWASFLTLEFIEKADTSRDNLRERTSMYLAVAGTENDVPVMIPSYILENKPAYRTASYNRPALAYNYLKEILGMSKFRFALKEYIKRWNGRHPIPYDFFFTFNDAAGESLDWFWKPWFFELGYPDLSISKAEKYGSHYEVHIKKVGALPIPIKLKALMEDGSVKEFYEPVTVWKEKGNEVIFGFDSEEELKRLELGSSRIPDVNTENNIIIR